MSVNDERSQHTAHYYIILVFFLQAKPMFHITFNVIVSGNSWDWDDSSELYIYFHAPELGGGNEFFPWTTQSRYNLL